MGSCWPGVHNTGVPSGTTLIAYSGPSTITANNTVIDSKLINTNLVIQASNVTITNSRLNGRIYTPDGSLSYSFTMTDSESIAPQAEEFNGNATAMGEANFTLTRVEITGGEPEHILS